MSKPTSSRKSGKMRGPFGLEFHSPLSGHRAARLGSFLAAVPTLFAITGLPGMPAVSAIAAPAIRDLGSLGGTFSSAVAVNGTGQVVGQSETTSDQLHAFSWTADAGMVDLGTLGGSNSQAQAVNDGGQVVGHASLASGYYHAFSWTASGGMSDLGTLGGNFSQALAVNNAGQVVGWADTGTGQQHAFVSSPSGLVDLGTLGGNYSEATGINGAGDVIGDSTTSAGSDNAFEWTSSGGMVDLGTLSATANPMNDVSYPDAINQSGDVAGYATTTTGDTHGFFWSATGGMADLGTLGGNLSLGQAVNGAGEVVGVTTDSSGSTQGFTWTATGGMVKLGDSIADGAFNGGSTDPSSVNDAGQVIGWADVGSNTHAFSWTPAGGMVDLGTLDGGSYSSAVAENGNGMVVGYSGTPTGQHAVLWQAADDDLALTGMPQNITTNATGPSGAIVTYKLPGVTDGDSPLVGCSPAPGSTFAIGTTTVTCTAIDSDDNPASVSQTFTITVNGASSQLSALYQAVQGVGPGTSLATKVQQAQSEYSAGDTVDACSALAAFTHQVNAQYGKSIATPIANTLLLAAARIRAVIAC